MRILYQYIYLKNYEKNIENKNEFKEVTTW